MKELHKILARYRHTGATLGGPADNEGPTAPRLGRDLEVGIAGMRRRELVWYGAAALFMAALLGTFVTTAGKQPMFAVALMGGMAFTMDQLRRVSRERDAMDLVLALCRTADEPTIAAVIAGVQRPAPRRAAPGGPTLPFGDVQLLHDAAIRLRLDRDALLGGIDRHVVASFPVFGNLSAQMLSDLHELNRIGTATGGDAPLLVWLRNAKLLAGLDPESETIERCLRALEAVPVTAPGARS